jgi:hypothetical protein
MKTKSVKSIAEQVRQAMTVLWSIEDYRNMATELLRLRSNGSMLDDGLNTAAVDQLQCALQPNRRNPTWYVSKNLPRIRKHILTYVTLPAKSVHKSKQPQIKTRFDASPTVSPITQALLKVATETARSVDSQVFEQALNVAAVAAGEAFAKKLTELVLLYTKKGRS